MVELGETIMTDYWSCWCLDQRLGFRAVGFAKWTRCSKIFPSPVIPLNGIIIMKDNKGARKIYRSTSLECCGTCSRCQMADGTKGEARGSRRLARLNLVAGWGALGAS